VTASARAARDPVGEVFLSRDELAARVDELADEISRDYAGREPLLVAVLHGAFVFVSDLSRSLSIPHGIDFLALAGYGGPLGGSPAVRLLKDLDGPIADRDVLVVENVVDTGLTLNYLLRALSLRKPADLAVCALLDRPYRRLCDDLPIRYVGFSVPDQFFVGYGFSLHGRHRGLPDLRIVRR
jgi:hypoxanthine phosphoribosyltransferase